MTHLVLVRHGTTDWNDQGRFQGHSDPPLNAVGRALAERLAQRLAEQSFDAVYSSDLARAYQTAQIIAPQMRIYTDPNLREINFGVFEGLTYDQIASRYPAELAAWEADRDHAPPDGETLSVFAVRINRFIEHVCAVHPKGSLLVVAHGGTLRVLLCLALGLSPSAQWRLRVDTLSVSEIHFYPQGAILSRLNDTGHLNG